MCASHKSMRVSRSSGSLSYGISDNFKLHVQVAEDPAQGGNSGADNVFTEDNAFCRIDYSSAASLFRLQGSPDPPSSRVPGRQPPKQVSF